MNNGIPEPRKAQPKNNTKVKKIIGAIWLLLFFVIFIIDLQTPIGIADGMLYIAVLLPFIWTPRSRFIVLAAIGAVVLITAGYFLSPVGSLNMAFIAITNRLISIVLVIVCAWILIQYKKTQKLLLSKFREIENYKYALDESSIIAITDQKGIIKKVNHNFCEISKFSELELIGQDHRIINSGYHSSEFIRELWVTIANGKIWKGEFKNKAKDGTLYWVDTTIVPFLNDNGKPFQYLAIRSDITQRKQAEEHLIKQNEELEKFVYVSSHDLQEPLRKIQSFTQLMIASESQNLSENGLIYLDRLQSFAKQMQTLIKDLLSYSHYNTALHKFENIDLGEILNDVKVELNSTILQKNATIETEGLGIANVIPFQFHRLLNSLLSNALKFSQTGIAPYIKITSKVVTGNQLNKLKLSPKNKYLCITVSDNGVGFDSKYNERVFELFQRLNSKEEYSGSGVGLAIAKKIVENHNGIITVASEPNKGTSFEIYIPLIRDPTIEAEPVSLVEEVSTIL